MAQKKGLALGDKVTFVAGPYKGQKGTIVEVAVHDQHWFNCGHEQLYGVRLEPWEKVERPYLDKLDQPKVEVRYRHPSTGEVRDHEADTIGCVRASELG